MNTRLKKENTIDRWSDHGFREKIKRLVEQAEKLNRVHEDRIEESRNRYEAAKKLEEGDRIPISVWLQGMSGWYLQGKYKLNMSEYFRDPKLQAFYQLKERIDAFREWGDDRLEIDTVVGVTGGVVAHPSAIGCKIFFPQDDWPWVDVRYHPLDTPEKIDDFQVPEIAEAGIMPQMMERYEKMKKLVGGLVSKVYLGAGNGYPGRPLQMSVYARGYNSLIKDMYTDPQLAHKLLRKMCAVCEAFHSFYRDHFGRDLSRYEVVDLYDNFLHHFSPPLLRKFVLPHYSKWAEKYGWKYWNIASQCVLDPFIEIMTEIPTKCVTYLASSSNLRLFKETFTPRKVWIQTAYEPSLMLVQTPQEIERESKRIIEIMAPSGGFIMGTGCLDSRTPEENIQTFIETSKKYGKY